MHAMTIFFIWLGSVLPESYDKKVKECIAAYQNCIVLGEKEYTELTNKYNIHHNNNILIQRADLLKLLYLQQYGGIFMDFDVEIRDWNILKQMNCQDTYFGEEQWKLIHYAEFVPSNYIACSPKNTSELARLIKGIQPKDTVLDYAGPAYLQKMKVKFMPFYPNIKHCYHNKWMQGSNDNCFTPNYRTGQKSLKPT